MGNRIPGPSSRSSSGHSMLKRFCDGVRFLFATHSQAIQEPAAAARGGGGSARGAHYVDMPGPKRSDAITTATITFEWLRGGFCHLCVNTYVIASVLGRRLRTHESSCEGVYTSRFPS